MPQTIGLVVLKSPNPSPPAKPKALQGMEKIPTRPEKKTLVTDLETALMALLQRKNMKKCEADKLLKFMKKKE